MNTNWMTSMMFTPSLGSLQSGTGVLSPVVINPPCVSPQDALKHVLDHVFCLPSSSGLRQSLQAKGYGSIHQVIGMPMASIKALSYKVKVDGITISHGLSLCEEDTLVALQWFACFQKNALGHPLTPVDWCQITEIEFDTYLGSYHLEFVSANPNSTRTPHVQDLCADHTMGSDYNNDVAFPETNDGLYLDHNMGSNSDDDVVSPDTDYAVGSDVASPRY